LFLRPWCRYPSLVVPWLATCLSIASATYRGRGNVAELPRGPEVQRTQLPDRVDLLSYAEGGG
jgi:hypothetical protein